MLVSDVDVPPQTNLWGKLKKTLPFGDVSIRGDVNANAPEVVDVDLRATVYGTSLQLLGSAGTYVVDVSFGFGFGFVGNLEGGGGGGIGVASPTFNERGADHPPCCNNLQQ
jgi:hypothetical protein